MEALTLTHEAYEEGLVHVASALKDGASYLDQFKIVFPDGLNTASVMEICRVIQNATMENKVHLMRLCVTGKLVEVTCPNGEVEKFVMTSVDDSLNALPLFNKEPLAMIAIADAIYGYILKKSVRPSKPSEPAVKQG